LTTRKLPRRTHFHIDGPAGRLEALLECAQDTEPAGCAVVCHPHPLHGGTMQNKVAHTLARSFAGIGFAALRFNFRGVGESEGRFDDGNGEVDDVLAALRWMRAELPDLPLWLSGFSFGAAMAVRAAVASKPDGLISIAPAVTRFAGNLLAQPECPWLILQGDQDELVDVEETIAWVNKLEPGPELEIFPDTEHFFHGKLVQLRRAVEDFVRRNEDGPAMPGDDERS
jgi:alpha/beta superfamily hydrolase